MESTSYFDVICLAGPHNGQCVTLPKGRQAWEVWRPVIEADSSISKVLMGSYMVDPDRICATWKEGIGFSHPGFRGSR